MAPPALTSTTAPGKVFASRVELAEHYKSDWHKYNLKRREAGLPLLPEEEFRARLEAALALRREREGREERNGTNHLKGKKKKNKKKSHSEKTTGVVAVSQAPAYDRIKEQTKEKNEQDVAENEPQEEESQIDDDDDVQEEPPVIDPKQSLFDKHISSTLEENIERMGREFGFFIPDQEFLVDKEGFLGYCHEKIKLGHRCLYCQKVFRSWHACQKHMISTRHTKLRYERGIDQDEFEPFYDFSVANAEFLGTENSSNDDDDDDDDEWEDVGDEEDVSDEDGDGLYAGYEDEISKFGFDVTPLGELVFPDGRIVGHRGLARYYKQRVASTNDNTAVVAARRAAGERLWRGRVYNVEQPEHMSTLALARNDPGSAGRAGKGVLVNSGAGGYTALSLYRYRAVVKKARREEAQSQRRQHKSTLNINRMDKKANRLMNGVSVAHASR